LPILFLYREVLQIDLPWLSEVTRAKKPQRLPVVLTVGEKSPLFAALEGDSTITMMVSLLYGTGMRLMGVVRLRVKDVDLSRREIVVRNGKGRRTASRCCRTVWWHLCGRDSSIGDSCSIRTNHRAGSMFGCPMPWP
jgi:site-specific recombinase XerD